MTAKVPSGQYSTICPSSLMATIVMPRAAEDVAVLGARKALSIAAGSRR